MCCAFPATENSLTDFQIISPENRSVLHRIYAISGTGNPCARVTATIDGTPFACATINSCGNWIIAISSPLSCGFHEISVQEEQYGVERASASVLFTIQ